MASLLAAPGCGGSNLPKTFPVSGSVVYQGGQPLKGGSLQFTSEADPLLRVIGEIQPDGKFTLRTIKENDEAAGVPVGEYEVVVTLPRPPRVPGNAEAAQRSLPPITLPRTYKIDGKDNALKIELPEPPPN